MHKSGFRAILTRDRLFGESAARALKAFPDVAFVILLLPQSREGTYLVEFENRWQGGPIQPIAGAVIAWP